MQHAFTMKKGTEFPERFAGLVITQSVPVDVTTETTPEDFGKQCVAAVGGDILTAQALFNGRWFLEHQKDVKERANSKDLAAITDDAEAKQSLVDWAAGHVVKVRLREQSENAGQPKKQSAKQKETAAKATVMDSLLASLTPEQRALYEAKMAEVLGATAAPAAEAPAEEQPTEGQDDTEGGTKPTEA